MASQLHKVSSIGGRTTLLALLFSFNGVLAAQRVIRCPYFDQSAQQIAVVFEELHLALLISGTLFSAVSNLDVFIPCSLVIWMFLHPSVRYLVKKDKEKLHERVLLGELLTNGETLLFAFNAHKHLHDNKGSAASFAARHMTVCYDQSCECAQLKRGVFLKLRKESEEEDKRSQHIMAPISGFVDEDSFITVMSGEADQAEPSNFELHDLLSRKQHEEHELDTGDGHTDE